MTTTRTDVLVIGGGPAGTTFATLMAQRGWDVTLVEKDQHPRFHIGESLLPMNVPIFERLGVLEQIREIGVVKRGADFTLVNSETEYKTFHFDQARPITPSRFAAAISTLCCLTIAGPRVWMRVKTCGQGKLKNVPVG